MAALKLLGDTSLAADLGKIVGGLLVDVETVFAQIGGIGAAAATLRERGAAITVSAVAKQKVRRFIDGSPSIN
jgi:hypothetical protein